MNELINTQPDINVQEAEYIRLLGFPQDYVLEGRSLELANWARDLYSKIGKPWIYGIKSSKLNYSADHLQISNVNFASKKFRDQMAAAQADSAMLVAVSAGKECEEQALQLWNEGKPDEYFFLEVYGSAVVEHLITNTGAVLCAWADDNKQFVLPHYSPGYTGWNVTDQRPLLALINKMAKKSLPGKIDVFDSGMLNPKKSMLAIFGLTKHIEQVKRITELIPCETCSYQNCQFRRKPFKYHRKSLEDARLLQPTNQKSKQKPLNVLNENAKYSIGEKTLKKWTNERLTLKPGPDGIIDAFFKYEGTTCSNLGHPLEFNYFCKLSSKTKGYTILDLDCSPAGDDTGYTYMCEYLKDDDLLMESIKNEKPFLGKRLNDILSWKREYNPESCLCNASGRDHKWGLVFEVIHFALAKNEESKASNLNNKIIIDNQIII